MAKSKFDMNLLKPMDGNSADFESKLKPLDVEDEDPGAYLDTLHGKGVGSIGSDIAGIPGHILNYGLNLPGKASEGWGQIFNKPVRAIKNLAFGTGNLAKELINLPHTGLKYLGEKDVIPEWLKEYNETGLPIPFTGKHIPTHLPDFGIDKLMGIENQEPGDEILRQMMMFAPVPGISKIPGGEAFTRRAEGLAKYGPLKRGLEELEQAHEGATAQHMQDTTRFNALKDFLEGQAGYETANPNRLRGKAQDVGQDIARLEGEAQKIPEHLRSTNVTEEPIINAENALKDLESKRADIETKFGQGHLRRGYAHDLPIAEKVTAKLKANKQEISNQYKGIEADLTDKNVLVPQTKEIIHNEESARALLENSRHLFKNDKDFDNAVQQIVQKDKNIKHKGPSDIIPAADVLRNYRTMRHLAEKLRKEAYSTKVAGNKDLQKELLDKADEFENVSTNLESALEKNDLGDSLVNLKSANKRWREEVVPLYKNKTYRQFLNGLGPENIMKALRGTGPGQEIIRQIIKEDPELLRNIVGQRYAKNPEKLHEFDELTEEYTKHMPEVAEFKKQHLAAIKAQEEASQALHRAKSEHPLRQKHDKITSEIKGLQERKATLERHAQKISGAAKNKNISLKKKMELEAQISKNKKELANIEKDINIRRKILKGLGYGLGAVLLGDTAYKKAKNII